MSITPVGSDGKPIKPKVLIACPNDGYIRHEVVAKLMMLPLDNRAQVAIMLNQDRPIDHNRGTILRHFLSQPFDFLLTMDADNPPIRNPFDLLFAGKDVVTFPTPMFRSKALGTPQDGVGLTFNLFDQKPDGTWRDHDYQPGEAWQQVDATGAGCLLIRRKVLETLGLSAFASVYKDGQVVEGTDIAFSRRCRKAGFEIWANFNYPCQHFKVVDLLAIKFEAAKEPMPDCPPAGTPQPTCLREYTHRQKLQLVTP